LFESILRELLVSTPGAIGAIVLDQEGESIQFWAERVFDIGPDGMKAIGAYQGIYLSQLKLICERIQAGPPLRFATNFTNSKILSYALKDGYYVVLIADPGTNEGMAWHHLRSARQRLLAEL